MRTRILTGVIALSLMANTACLLHSRKVQSHLSTATLQTATAEELVGRINAEAQRIRTLNATVDIATSVGGQKKGKVTEYQEIRGYILAEKPSSLRMIGLFPIVRNRAFDMVSDGQRFKLWIPPKNRFITGLNEVTVPSTNALENLRPQVIYNALLLQAIDPQTEIAVLEGGTQEIVDPKDAKKTLEQPNYKLDIIHRDPSGTWTLARKIYFNRVNMLPYRQVIFDKLGNVATDASYSDFEDREGIQFPNTISIERPQEEYTIGLHVVSVKINTQLKADTFELQVPTGAEVKVLGPPPQSAQNSR